MRDISVSPKQLITKSIFASFVLHFFFLNILIFCFSIPSGIKKPFFVFLGSILQKQDLLVSGLRYSSMTIPFIDLCQPTERFVKFTTDGGSQRIRSLGCAKINDNLLATEDSAKIHSVPLGKPDFHRTIAVKGKSLFKIPISLEEQTPLESIENKLEREFPSPAYAPLRLQLNDKN